MDKTIIIKSAAVILNGEANAFVYKATDVSWSPIVDELKKDSRKPPWTVMNFFRDVISSKNSHHNGAFDSTNRISMSFSEDLLFVISNGKFLTLKHTTIALGLHSPTGEKVLILAVTLHFT